MEKKKLIFYTTISFLIAISIFVFINRNSSNDNLLKPTDQNIEERNWIPINIDTIFVKKIAPPIFYQPFKMKVDENNNIYIIDRAKQLVAKFSPKGYFLTNFGKGKGKGPGEFMNISDFNVGSDGKVYIIDGILKRISIFDSTSKLEKIVEIKKSGYLIDKFEVLSNQEYFIRDIGVGDFFKIYDHSGNLVNSFGNNYLANQNSIGFPLGVYLCRGGSNIYGVFARAGYIFGYKPSGQLLFYRETIDKFPFPKFNITKNSVFYAPNSALVNWDISYSPNKDGEGIIYVHPGYASRKIKALIIDAYLAKDGKYLYSFKIRRPSNKHGMTSFIIHGENLYLVGAGVTTLLIKYKFNIKQAEL